MKIMKKYIFQESRSDLKIILKAYTTERIIFHQRLLFYYESHYNNNEFFNKYFIEGSFVDFNPKSRSLVLELYLINRKITSTIEVQRI